MSQSASIALIDYGAGNVPSVERALRKLGVTVKRVTRSSELVNASAIILPGVGHYEALIRALDAQHLRGALLDTIHGEIPFLGICLGLQALYAGSEEAPNLAGLNLFSGVVRALPATAKLPHMGWNRLHLQRPSALLAGLSDRDYFYFAHTFAAAAGANSREVVATCDYGTSFIAALEHNNIFATQFHPEKSGAGGARVLQNFLSIAA